MRIGQGFDIHRLAPENPAGFIMLGGVEVAFDKSIVAHSDGDVALHALADALCGACALGDIGQHFPDTDAAHQGADSAALLSHIYELVQSKGYVLSNADMTIIAEQPKLKKHIPEMRRVMADLLGVPIDDISVKATTHEKLDALGQVQGIAVHAVVLLKKA